MKKQLIILLLVLLSLPVLASDFKYTYQGQTLPYEVLDEAARTCQTTYDWSFDDANKYIGANVVIPSVVKDKGVEYTVVKIGDNTFRYATHLLSVEIPNTVQAIGTYAFDYCSHLENIIIPESVKVIERYAFSGCEALKSITLGNSIEEIDQAAFSGCAVSVINLPASLKKLEEQAFDECSNLQVMYINSVLEFTSYPVGNCDSFSKVIFPSNEVALGNEKYFKYFKNAFGRTAQIYVGDKPYTPVAAENNRKEIDQATVMIKDHGKLYWAKGPNGVRQIVNEGNKVILTDKYDKIYLEPHAIIVVKNGKFGAISYTGKVLANPIYNTYGGSGIESRLLFSNNTQTGEKFIIISKTGVILASKAFTRSQKYSATNWLNNWLKFINSPSWDYRAK